MQHFDTVLVANRGEIAVRVIRTLRQRGLRSVAVYSDADRQARHTTEADIAVHIGPRAAAGSYLHVPAVLAAAERTDAQAIHPGYGFLSENAEFARACETAGVVFIGPPPAAIEAMGDKISAKATVTAAGVPVVPGRSDPGMSDDDLVTAAAEVGFPVLLKPSAGGGGKGMRLVNDPTQLSEEITSARRESAAAFGDDTLFVERFLAQPRHIEVQILADGHDNVVHLGERECSLQRRHQKIVEEAPSPLLDEGTRARIGQSAADAARAVGYRGAGTVEFIVSADRPDEFFFMEMNTRLQVEHPVTELVTTTGDQHGVDLVEQQLRVAAGQTLPWSQDDLDLSGHALEARVYAEDPTSGFLPTGGRVLDLHEPCGAGVRVDSGIHAGAHVGTDYDPMLAKIITWGPDRREALQRLDAALGQTAILGLSTNIAFLRRLLAHPEVRAGRMDTGLVERDLDELTRTAGVPDQVYAAAALERLLAAEPRGPVINPWDVPGGWRLDEPATSTVRFAGPDDVIPVRLRGRAADAQVAVGEAAFAPASAIIDGTRLTLVFADQTEHYWIARESDTTWLTTGGTTWALVEHQLLTPRGSGSTRSDGVVTSPMPGTVLLTEADVGQHVYAGQRLFVVEAMKMEHTISAPVNGLLTEVSVYTGQSTELGQTMAVIKHDPPVQDAPP